MRAISFGHHVLEKVNKTNQTMGLIRRSLSYLDIQSFGRLFKAMIRRHLEHAQYVWSPFRKKDTVNIENVQRRAIGRLRGLAVACSTTDHYHSCSNLGVGISEGCFISDFASLPLGVARAHLAYRVHKSGHTTPIIIK